MDKNLEKQKVEIDQLYGTYTKQLDSCNSIMELLDICHIIYKEMEQTNENNGYRSKLKEFDPDTIYYIAKFVLSKRKDFFSDLLNFDKTDLPWWISQKTSTIKSQTSANTAEGTMVLCLASILYQYMTNQQKLIVHVIEPHPDDALGSASGICYNKNVITALHTITKSDELRKDIILTETERKKYSSLKKELNISRHEKYSMPDLHYDMRILDKDVSFAEKTISYQNAYSSLPELKAYIYAIISEALNEGAALSFPMGLEHPMHILIMTVCLECIKELSFDTRKLFIYVDHPYDFQLAETNRIMEVQKYISNFISSSLLRCDDKNAKQHQLEPIIKEIYGDLHYGEFDGSLNRTLCSYYITQEGYSLLQNYFSLQYNNILFITAQAWPFYKTGGLGEVAYGYCKALQSSVNDVRILMPEYPLKSFKEKGVLLTEYHFTYKCCGEVYTCRIKKQKYEDLIYYFLKIWDSSNKAIDFTDQNQAVKNFSLFCDIILQKGLNSIDCLPTVCHCNDWQTATIPFLKKVKYPDFRPDMKVVYTIHFYGHKGIYSKKKFLSQLEITKENCSICLSCQNECELDKIDLLNKKAKNELIEMSPNSMSCMRAGIEFADAVTTVSKGYAKDIKKYPDFNGINVIGIRNGIDTAKFKEGYPLTSDLHAGKNFINYKENKKRELQSELGLQLQKETPIICMVTRLAIEKGMNVVKNILPDLLEDPVQVVIIGDDSDKELLYSNFFKKIEQEHKGNFAYHAYSEELEYKTYAGSDILLMPSLSEACGTTQMIAMQYGVIPVISMLSGFQDTVLDYRFREERKTKHWEKGIGFYAYKDDCWIFLEVLKKVLEIYHTNPNEWQEMAKTCYSTDFTWKNGSIYAYLQLYNNL